MLGDKGFEPMNTVIITSFRQFLQPFKEMIEEINSMNKFNCSQRGEVNDEWVDGFDHWMNGWL